MSLAAMQVGAVALRFYGKVANLEKHIDRATVNDEHRAALEALSDVDLAAQEIVLLALEADYPWIAVEAEEDTPGVATFASNPSPYTVVLDPIDGTLNYITQTEQFAVMIGLMEDDRYLAGLVYFPLQGRLFRAIRGEGCTLTVHGQTTAVRTSETPNLVLRDAATPPEVATAIESLGFVTSRSGCSAVDSTVAATMSAAASISYHAPSIRRCIGALVSREAGGVLTDLHGHQYDCTHPRSLDSLLVARDRTLVDRLLEVIVPPATV